MTLFQGNFPDDLTALRNVKKKRGFAWLEQDADAGFQIKAENEAGGTTVHAFKPGVGLTQDSWNRTGWIWQKLLLPKNRLQAKFWSAAEPEPSGWQIVIENWESKPGRIGLRNWSGKASIAYYGVFQRDRSAPDIPFGMHASHATVYGEQVPSWLIYFNMKSALADATIHWTAEREGSDVGEAEWIQSLPAGHSEIEFVPEEDGREFPLSRPVPQGRITIRAQLRNKRGEEVASASRVVVFRSPSFYLDRIDQFTARAASRLRREPRPNTPKTVDAYSALANLDYCRQCLKAGDTELVEKTMDYVEEAVNEEIRVCRYTCEPVEMPAASFVMGETYEVPVTWKALGEAPTVLLVASLTLTDDLKIEHPITVRVEIPPEHWSGGVARTRFTLPIPHEYPPGRRRAITRPKIREGYGRLPEYGNHAWPMSRAVSGCQLSL